MGLSSVKNSNNSKRQPSAGQNSNLRNNDEVLTPNSIFKKSFELANSSVEATKDIANQIKSADELSDLEKVRLLRMLMDEISKDVQSLLPEPEPAPFLYKKRPIRSMGTVEFVKTYFPSYGKTLTLANLRQYDEYLYHRLYTERRQNPDSWNDFNLPTKEEFLVQRMEQLSDFEYQQVLKLSKTVHRNEKSLNK